MYVLTHAYSYTYTYSYNWPIFKSCKGPLKSQYLVLTFLFIFISHFVYLLMTDFYTYVV